MMFLALLSWVLVIICGGTIGRVCLVVILVRVLIRLRLVMCRRLVLGVLVLIVCCVFGSGCLIMCWYGRSLILVDGLRWVVVWVGWDGPYCGLTIVCGGLAWCVRVDVLEA